MMVRSKNKFTFLLAIVVFIATGACSDPTMRFRINGAGMEPGLPEGSFVVIDASGKLSRPLERGDLVVFYYPLNQDELFVKRVIAIAGDRIAIDENGVVILNGTPQIEDYAIRDNFRRTEELKIPPGYVFVLGDNRADSLDSRSFGPVDVNSILGKVILSIPSANTASQTP